MPRDISGNYTLPSGNPVTPGAIITSSWANSTMSDVATALTDSLDRNGRGGMLAPFQFTDGTVNNPAAAWVNEPTTGLYRNALGDLRMSILATDVMKWNQNLVSIWSTADQQWYPVVTEATALWQTDGTDVYRETGFVGIATDDPLAALHVVGASIVDSGGAGYSFRVATSFGETMASLQAGNTVDNLTWKDRIKFDGFGQRISFWTSLAGNADVERMNISSEGYIIINNIPTSDAGLPSGTLWSNAGVINIVP